MFASELSKQNKGTLSPFCLRQGFFEGSGMRKSSCHPTSAYTGVYDFTGPGIKAFFSPPPPAPLGAWMWGKGRTVALQTWGEEHTCHLYIWGHLRETISSQIRRVMGGRGQQGRLSLLPTTHPPFPLLPTTLKSDYRAPQTSYYFVPRLLNLVLHLCVDNSRHVLSRAGESKYIGDLSTPGQGLKREQ